MRKSRKIPIKVALVLLFLGISSTWAEVKLRIYLQDGTLQAGNLVAENPDSFVILNREGRIEVKKDQIMFINGKTLKQWQERPDKLFQTEIIPSDVPDPSYVNNKAPIPALPGAAANSSASAQKAKPAATDEDADSDSAPAAGSASTPGAGAAAVLPPPVIKPVQPLSASAPQSAGANSTSTRGKSTGGKSNSASAAANSASAASNSANAAGTSAGSMASTAAASPRANAVSAKAVAGSSSLSASAATAQSSAASASGTSVAAASAAAPVPVGRRRGRRGRRRALFVAQTAAQRKPATPQKSAAGQTPAAPLAASSVASPMSESTVDVVRPDKFIRKDFGDYHYQRALKFLDAGDRGRAVQELHFATVLDRQNGESTLLLGKLYMQEGQNARARKYFSHPLIRKREEVKTWLEEMDKTETEGERSKQISYGAAGISTFAWLPLLLLFRFLKKPPKRVFTAESVEELQSAQGAPPAPSEPAFTAFKPATRPPPDPLPLKKAEPPPALPPAPVAPLAAAIAPPPVALPSTPPPAPRFMEPVVPPPMPPPIVPPPIPAPLPEPLVVSAVEPPPNADGLDVQSVLRLAGMVDRAVRKGNGLALEEKFDMARREYRTALALNPACVEATIGLGYLCFAQSQWDLALEHYTKALGIDPKSADAHYGIGRVFLEIDRVDEAIYEFQKTLALDPVFDDARETLTALGATV